MLKNEMIAIVPDFTDDNKIKHCNDLYKLMKAEM